jgi:hypothetical protein
VARCLNDLAANEEKQMDGPQHYKEAERLLAQAKTSTDHFYGEQQAIPTLLAAMAHATLAAAAATATGSSADWMKTAGTRHSGDS